MSAYSRVAAAVVCIAAIGLLVDLLPQAEAGP